MERLPKIIAMYLPQFHRIPENDKFWGEGFTDWVTVKRAEPLYEGHQQPRVPLNDNYYDLSQKENVAWQAKLAKEHGIYGFGIYHYWFNNEQNLLTKPAEIIRDNDDIDINYCFVWDNQSWKRSWSSFKVSGNDWAPTAEKGSEHQGPQILVNYILGGEKEWEKHYRYVSTHFKKDKYIKIDGKPLFGIYIYTPEMAEMCKYWDQLAKEDGFNGIYFMFTRSNADFASEYGKYNYEPHAAGLAKYTFAMRIEKKLRRIFHREDHITYFNYDELWSNLLQNAKESDDKSLFFGAFTAYDDSPRRGKYRSKIVRGDSPEKFEKYFKQLVEICRAQKKEFVFLSAWNEWGEGMYLEPDTINGYDYLNAVKRCAE